MNHISESEPVFFTWVYSPETRQDASILIESIRTFGGSFSQHPVWVFESNPEEVDSQIVGGLGIERITLDTPERLRQYYYGHKVYASVRAEKLASEGAGSMIWVSPEMLFTQPPELFDLSGEFDAAVRPVHIQNVGLGISQAPDDFWQGVYRAVGAGDITSEVESFVDGQRLRSYFNSAAFAVDPSLGLCQRWLEVFEKLVIDQEFQESACQDDWHQVFLHQALLSALLASEISPERLRILPPSYIYPYNLHADVPPERQAHSLDELVCIYHEGRTLNPEKITDINLSEALKSWLMINTAG